MKNSELVSVIIPSRNELFLDKTVEDILNKAKGNIEVIVVLDGYWPSPPLKKDSRLKLIHLPHPKGMRNAINMAVAMARGKYIMKSDAHCMFNEGFDIDLSSNCDEDWVVIPRRLRLDAENWRVQKTDKGKPKPPIDYEFITAPGHHDPRGGRWDQRTVERMNNPKYQIDEDMNFQGSCWFTTKKHFDNTLKGLDEKGYGTFIRESYEIGLKTWLTGGKVMVNKNTWYAHLHKGSKYGRMYFLNLKEIRRGIAFCEDFWFNNRLKEAKHDLAWLVEKFWPVPTWTEGLLESVRKK